MSLNTVYIIVVVISSVAIFVSSIGIIIAAKFQKKQKMKYDNLEKIINENKNSIFKVKDNLTEEDIKKIDDTVDVKILMDNLYNTYLELEDKVKNLNCDLDKILTDKLKEFYTLKINSFKEKKYVEIIDGIELISYSITEFSKEKLKFRININCFNYMISNDKIIRGSNLYKVEQIILLSYEKINGIWLIGSYDKIYEKKLGN